MTSINKQNLQNWLFAIVCAVSVSLTAQCPASAAYSDETRCSGGDTAVIDERIVACDRFIASGGTPSLSVAAALQHRAQYYLTKREYDLAILDYSQSIALDSSCKTANYLNRGLAYAANGDDDRAFQDLNQQIACTPQYPDAFYQHGVALIGRRQFGAAMQDFDKVDRLCHSFFDGRFFCGPILAKTYFRQGQAEFAIHDYREALHKFIFAIEMAISPNNFF
jgi:tetratricopeptide (TPR) repeat protein